MMPQRLFSSLYALSLLVLAASCNSSRQEKQETVYAPYQEIEAPSSSIDIPIYYEIDRLEAILNRKIKKTLYDDNSFTDNNNDKLKLRIEKDGVIQINLKGNFLNCSIPLKVRLEKKTIGTKKIFGKEIFKKGNVVKFSAILFLSSKLSIDTNWKLLTDINYEGIEWKDRPEATFLKIDISKIVENQLENKMPELTEKFDESIYENLDIKQHIQKIWVDIQKPILLNKIGDKIWLQFSPFGITSTPITTQKGNIFLQLTVDTHAKTLSGAKPKYEVNELLPKLSLRKAHMNTFDLNIACKLSYTTINKILKSTLVKKEIFIEGERLVIKKAAIRGNTEKLLFDLSVGGDYSGHIVFEGTPKFNSETKSIEIEAFDFNVETEEWLLEMADQVLHDEIKQQIKEKLNIPLEGFLKQIPSLIRKGIEKGKLKEKLDIEVNHLQVDVTEIIITSKDFQFLVNGKGKMALELEKL